MLVVPETAPMGLCLLQHFHVVVLTQKYTPMQESQLRLTGYTRWLQSGVYLPGFWNAVFGSICVAWYGVRKHTSIQEKQSQNVGSPFHACLFSLRRNSSP